MNTKILKQKVSFVLQGLNQLLWPAVCINCGENICENDNNLCENCWNELLICTSADYCRRCGRDASKYAILEGVCPQCQGEKIYFDQIARSGVYSDALRKLLSEGDLSRREAVKLIAKEYGLPSSDVYRESLSLTEEEETGEEEI